MTGFFLQRFCLLLAHLCGVAAFVGITPTVRPTSLAAAKTTLTQDTTWKLRFLLEGLPTANGKKVDEIFTMDAHFVEEVGYEPPQGALQQIKNDNDRLDLKSSRWILSEDPTDRKDGLWVWGLFAEPLYPFLLLQMEFDAIALATPSSNEDGEDGDSEEAGDSILPFQLYVQMNHQREKEVGVILQGGEVKIREMETMKADPFGAATVEIYDEVTVGKLSVEAVEA